MVARGVSVASHMTYKRISLLYPEADWITTSTYPDQEAEKHIGATSNYSLL